MRGCSKIKEEKGYCGQCEGKKRLSYCSDDIELSWVDEIVTNELYKGVAYKYHIKQWHK